jgi:CheY-like chemotaxis protein
MSKTHILIIDDDKALVNRYKEILAKADYSLGYAYNGQDGIEKLKTIGADLVILDIKMPKMSGIKVLELIRDNPKLRKTKVLVISSYAYKGLGRKASKSGQEKGGWKGRFEIKHKSYTQEKKFLGEGRGIAIIRTRHLDLKSWLIDEVENALKAKPQVFEREKEDSEPNRILIVDDEKDTVHKIASWLKPEGYELLFAYNGTEALEKISKEPIDLVILDLKMPETTGEDVIRIMRSIPVVRDIPIVVFSSVQDTTTTDSLMDLMPTREFIDETNIRSRIHRYKYTLGETYDKPEESKFLTLLHLDKPRSLVSRVKKELSERRRIGYGYKKRPITLLRSKKGNWLEGYLEAYKEFAGERPWEKYPCSYCEEDKYVAYESRLPHVSFDRYLCEDCAKELKEKYPSFAKPR